MKIINKYISVSDSANNKTGEIYIYGDISDEKWFDEDVTPNSILNELKSFGNVNSIDVHLNSYGGSCIAGNAIINVLDGYRRKTGAKINVYNDGIAASMGSGIASIGDKVFAAENSLFMYHRPISLACGNADELQKTIEVLEKTEDTLISNYMRRFKGTEDELKQILADETWMSAKEAKEYGFVDEIIQPTKIAASAKGININNQTFDSKIADIFKDKYQNIKIDEEGNKLTYDENLKNYGIDETMFESFNMESERIMQVVNAVNDYVKPEPVEQFMDKAKALEVLGCDDITADEILDYAKTGMNPPDVPDTTEIQNKANEYDKILDKAREDALKNALKAQGDSYNESRMKKYLSILDYSEIIDQSNAWAAEAKNALHAGVRVSVPESNIKNQKAIKPEDFEF